jgi:hypothetical protein
VRAVLNLGRKLNHHVERDVKVVLLLNVDVGSGFEHLTELFDLVIATIQMFQTLDAIGLDGTNRLVIVTLALRLVLLTFEDIEHVKIARL